MRTFVLFVFLFMPFSLQAITAEERAEIESAFRTCVDQQKETSSFSEIFANMRQRAFTHGRVQFTSCVDEYNPSSSETLKELGAIDVRAEIQDSMFPKSELPPIVLLIREGDKIIRQEVPLSPPQAQIFIVTAEWWFKDELQRDWFRTMIHLCKVLNTDPAPSTTASPAFPKPEDEED